ncbi:MAG TPA: YfhO family protein [bacterium]|nr:YfhO family protein [bacterium]
MERNANSKDQSGARARCWLGPLLCLAFFALIFHRFWTHGIIFLDSFKAFAPTRWILAGALGKGTIDAWRPGQFLGMPFAAEVQTAWFYPLNVIYVLLPFEIAHRVFILIHYPLAAIFMYLFLRGRGLERAAAWLGAVAFALSGYMVWQLSNLVFLIGPAWAPLALYCMDRAEREGTAWSLGAGAVLAVQVLAGEPQSAAITAVIIALISAARAVRGRRQALIALAVAGASSIALSAVQMLPTIELMRLSLRRAGVTLSEASDFSFHPLRLVELIWPTPFGAIWPEFTFFGKFLLEDIISIPWSLTNYLGLPVIALAAVGAVKSQRRWKLAPAIAALFFLVLSFGGRAPLFPLLFKLPIFNSFRYPEKYLAWFAGCLAVLAALGLEEIVRRLRENPSGLARPALIYLGAVVLLLAGSAVAWPLALDRVAALTRDPALRAAALSHLFHGGIQIMLVNTACGAILFLAARKKLPINVGAALFLAVIIADLYAANVREMPEGPADLLKSRPLAAGIIAPYGPPPAGQYRIFRRDALAFRDMYPALLAYPRMERQGIWEWNTLESNFHVMAGFENITGYNSSVPENGFELLWKGLTPRMLELYNVRYVLAPFNEPEVRGVASELIFRDQASGLAVIRLPDALPRAYWAPSALAAANEREAIALVERMDVRRQIVITTDEKIDTADTASRGIVPASIARYEPEEVVIECDAPAAGWLILSDRFYPGWRAQVDGKEAEIHRANVMVRGVRVPEGRHTVRFTFRSRPLRIGACISVPAWIAVIAYWAAAWRSRRSKPRTASPAR